MRVATIRSPRGAWRRWFPSKKIAGCAGCLCALLQNKIQSQMEKKELSIELRLLLAFALSFAVVMLARYFLPKPPPPQQKPPAQQAKAAVTQVPASAPAEAKPGISPAPATSLKQGAAEQEITIESDLYKIVLSSRGGVVKSWALKRYRDDQNHPLDLVDQEAAGEFGYPFSIWSGDESLRQEVNTAIFVPSATGTIQAPASLTFEYNSNRIAARKEITFTGKDYIVEIKTGVWSDRKPVVHEIAWRGGFGDIHDIGMRGNVLDVFYRDPQKMTRLSNGDVKSGELSSSGPFEFSGIEDRFFTAAFLPAGGPLRVTTFRHDVTVAGQTKKRPSMGMAVGSPESPQNRLRLFVGPKDTDLLAAIHPRLPELVDYGWFFFVAKPLFQAMRWIHDHVVSNYGWAIILLTVFINFAMFPLKLKSLRSSSKMQKIQPQIRAVQDKYKQYKMKDPRKAEMNQEMMALYKEHGVNPLGGCLPMLIQMPFLYGFYKVLVVSIEMRHAPWFWWVHDLSAPEHIPIKVLPLAMCATQFVLQKMSPAPSPDPAQQKVMMFMPVMFLFLFWNLSSGLVLYWLTGNVVGIVQQWYINRTELQQVVEKKKGRGGKKQAVER